MPGNSVGARVHCRWIRMGGFDDLDKDMLD